MATQQNIRCHRQAGQNILDVRSVLLIQNMAQSYTTWLWHTKHCIFICQSVCTAKGSLSLSCKLLPANFPVCSRVLCSASLSLSACQNKRIQYRRDTDAWLIIYEIPGTTQGSLLFLSIIQWVTSPYITTLCSRPMFSLHYCSSASLLLPYHQMSLRSSYKIYCICMCSGVWKRLAP